MNRQEALKLYDTLVGMGGHGSLVINTRRSGLVRKQISTYYKITIHASAKDLTKIMAYFVKETGISLKKELSLSWQVASGGKGDLSVVFFPLEDTFTGCRLRKKVGKKLVPATKAHYDKVVTYEVECNGEVQKAK